MNALDDSIGFHRSSIRRDLVQMMGAESTYRTLSSQGLGALGSFLTFFRNFLSSGCEALGALFEDSQRTWLSHG